MIDAERCVGLPPMCWVSMDRRQDMLGGALGGVVYARLDGVWINLETSERWPGDPLRDFAAPVSLGREVRYAKVVEVLTAHFDQTVGVSDDSVTEAQSVADALVAAGLVVR